jgi:predicted phosphoribosyltransferase
MAIRDLPELRGREHVFRDRAHAGELLAGLLAGLRGSDACLLAIPAGGVPVAAALARALGLPLDVAVVSKITLPWNTEVGYGAVAFDGSVCLNHELIEHVRLSDAEVRAGIEATRAKVQRRAVALRGAPGPPAVMGGVNVLVDDGLASGFTMRAAVRALRAAGAARIAIAVPTGSRRAVDALAGEVDDVYCANLRGGASFAVADAYQRWCDVEESEAAALLKEQLDRRRP